MEIVKKSIAASVLIALGVCANLTLGGIPGAVLFAFGLLGVCILQLNLFTGKCGYIVNKDINIKDLLIILVVNVISGYIIGYFIGFMNPEIVFAAVTSVSTWTLTYTYFIKAIFCGIVMWLAVDMFKKGTQFGIFFGVPLFILCSFQHSIANSITLGIARCLNPQNIMPLVICILGNFIGSAFICFLVEKK